MLSLLLLVMAMAVPARVAACSCMEQTVADAVRGADVAFVGTLASTDQPIPAAMDPTVGNIVWSWDVERSRDALPTSRIDIEAATDNGANCGVSFGLGEKWLVIAHRSEGALTSSSCSGNQLLDGGDPAGAEQIAGMLTVIPDSAPPAPATPAAPSLAVIFVLGVVAVLAAVSGWAFLRRRPS